MRLLRPLLASSLLVVACQSSDPAGTSGVTTLIAQHVEGVDVEATFSWTDQEKLLVLFWSGGKPEPRQLGAFE
jgi:hypothetical protein